MLLNQQNLSTGFLFRKKLGWTSLPKKQSGFKRIKHAKKARKLSLSNKKQTGISKNMSSKSVDMKIAKQSKKHSCAERQNKTHVLI